MGKIGVTVFIIGRYTPCGDDVLIKAKIDHIQHRQFVAYTVGDEPGEWRFSKKHIGKAVFCEREAVEKVLEENRREAGDTP